VTGEEFMELSKKSPYLLAIWEDGANYVFAWVDPKEKRKALKNLGGNKYEKTCS